MVAVTGQIKRFPTLLPGSAAVTTASALYSLEFLEKISNICCRRCNDNVTILHAFAAELRPIYTQISTTLHMLSG